MCQDECFYSHSAKHAVPSGLQAGAGAEKRWKEREATMEMRKETPRECIQKQPLERVKWQYSHSENF